MTAGAERLSSAWLAVVTRPAEQAEGLARELDARGARVLRVPALAIAGPPDPALAARRMAAIGDYDWVLFVSANAVAWAWPLLPAGGIPDGVGLAAVGAATAAALRERGVADARVPERPADSDALLALEELQWMQGCRVLIVRAPGGRERLAEVLRGRGARVDYAEVYSRIRPSIDVGPLREGLAAGTPLVTTVTSAQLLENLLSALDEATARRLRECPLVVIGPRLERLARAHGFARVTVAGAPNDTELAAAAAAAAANRQA